MIAALNDVLVTLMASAAWDLMLQPAFEAWTHPAGDSAFQKASATAAGRMRRALPKVSDVAEASLVSALMRPEVRELVRQIYYSRAGRPPAPLSKTRHAFATVWPRITSPDLDGMNAFEVFDALVAGCEATLDAGVMAGSVSAHEAKAVARAPVLNERLDAIDRHLRLLTRPNMINLDSADALEQSVRLATADATSTITPPSFEGARPVAINDLYVPPRFQRIIADDEVERLNYKQLVPGVDRMVVLGNPGAGKSTLARKLCHDLASGQSFAAGGLSLAPLLVELRRYGASALSSEVSLRDYFVSLISSNSRSMHAKTKWSIYCLRAAS